VTDDHIAIHGHDTREWCIYDFEGHASHMAHGALLETLRIAAADRGLQTDWSIRPAADDRAPVYDVRLVSAPVLAPDRLGPYIVRRTVQRRPMRTTALTAAQRMALAEAPGPGYEVRFFETFQDRLRVARLLWASARIRLTCPEAYQVHREVIEWGAQFSADRIPERAVGVDPLTGKLMRWVMHSWERVEFFNRYLMGTMAPRLQLDFVPALACASHVLLLPNSPLGALEDYVRLGVAMQRLWLTATAQGLHLQPEMTPVIFRWYARSGGRISRQTGIDTLAARLAGEFEALAGSSVAVPLGFFCRVGSCNVPTARSTRKSLAELM
jgi:hypothetical protein